MIDENYQYQPQKDQSEEALWKSPYSTNEKICRILWAIVQQTLFVGSFHNWYRFRRTLLKIFGCRINANVCVRRTVKIEIPWNLIIGANTTIGDRAIIYCLGKVKIGNNVTISQGAHICAGTHDYRTRKMKLKKSNITIGNDVWIAAEAFVGPDVIVGDGAVLGARSVTFSNANPWTVYLGNPATAIKKRDQLNI